MSFYFDRTFITFGVFFFPQLFRCLIFKIFLNFIFNPQTFLKSFFYQSIHLPSYVKSRLHYSLACFTLNFSRTIELATREWMVGSILPSSPLKLTHSLSLSLTRPSL